MNGFYYLCVSVCVYKHEKAPTLNILSSLRHRSLFVVVLKQKHSLTGLDFSK